MPIIIRTKLDITKKHRNFFIDDFEGIIVDDDKIEKSAIVAEPEKLTGGFPWEIDTSVSNVKSWKEDWDE